MTPQRQLGSSVVACLVGAGLTAYGATRVWSVQITERPGLTALRSTTTGAARSPWLIGLALVALAGAGALLATRGLPRRLLGAVLTATGLGLIVAAITGRAGLDPGSAGPPATIWPIACALAGALIAWAGVTAVRHAHHWPAMGSRYDRTATELPTAGATSPEVDPAGSATAGRSTAPQQTAPPAYPAPAEDRPSVIAQADTRAAWDALDRGDDPTTH